MTTLRRVLPLGRRDELTAAGLFWIVLAVYTATFSGLPDNPDAEVDFQTTSALVRNGTFGLGGTPEAGALVEARHNVRWRAERSDWVGRYGVGSALVSIPFYLAGRALAALAPSVAEQHEERTHYGAGRSEYWEHLVVGWRNPLFGAAIVALLFLTARRAGTSRGAASSVACGLAFASFLWPQARSTLSDVPATLCVTWALERLFALRGSLARGEPSARTAALLSVALVAALAMRVATLPLVLVLGGAGAACLFALRRARPERRRRAWLAFALPLVVGVALLGLSNHVRFGGFANSGYEDVVASGTWWARRPWIGLAGLLVSPGRGLVWMAPAIVLVPFAFVVTQKLRERLLPRVLVLGGLGTLALSAALGGWHGGHSYGPRYLLPALPLGFLAVAFVLDGWRAPWVRAVWRGALALGALVAVPGVLVDASTHHDLALSAAAIEWPDVPGDEESAELERFERTLWDPRFAAPWAHWRILRHKLAVGDDTFGSGEIFFLADDRPLTLAHARSRGFHHLGLVDLAGLLGHTPWAVWAGLVLAGAIGVVMLARSSDAFGR